MTNERLVLPGQGGDGHPQGDEHQEEGERPGDRVAQQPHGQRVQQQVGQGHLVTQPPQGDPDQSEDSIKCVDQYQRLLLPGRVVMELPGAGAPAEALGHGVVIHRGGQHQPRHLPPHTGLAVQAPEADQSEASVNSVDQSEASITCGRSGC